jgi:epoxyqueuosine reductase
MIEKIVKQNLIPASEYIYGFADLHCMLPRKYSDYPYGISIGRKLDDTIVDNIKAGPTFEYYNHYGTINKELKELTEKIHSELKEIGVESMALQPTISFKEKGYEKYLQKLTWDVSHKMVATRAGLGWIGKTALFVSNKFGPRLRLVTILLKDDPGIKSVPVGKSKCGKCNICVERCPAGAANGKLWNIKVHRDEFFDAKRCREKCSELAMQRLNVDERICGLCVSVCPIGQQKLVK